MTGAGTGTIVVFGGAGFVGTHLVRRLAAGHPAPKVISADLKPPRERLAGVDYRIADVRDLAAFDVAGPISRIYNFAAVHTTPGHPDHEYYETNVAGAVEVTRLAHRYDVPEIVFTSSISVYGPGEDTKAEDSPLTPVSAYGFSKMLAERVHRQWHEAAPGRRLTIVRPAVVFGEGERGNFTRLAALLKKGVFVYPGRKDTIKACIYVEDLLETIEFARGEPEDLVIFNGAYPQRYTLEDIVETFAGDHFPKARTFLLPRSAVVGAATLMRGLGTAGLGIHPERVMKLVRSTDVVPGWLTERGMTFPNALPAALAKWSRASGGSFK